MRPQPILAMEKRHRLDGSPFLVAVAREPLTLPAGAELHLRRIAPDGEEPTHALQVVLPVADRAAWLPRRDPPAEEDQPRLDGSVLRDDPRDADGPDPPF